MTQDEAIKTIGANVRRLRRDSGMTQVELAKAVNVTQATISSLESGSKDFTIGLIADIAEVLNEPIDMLLRSEKIPAAH